MALIIDILSWASFIVGGFFLLIGSLGMLRLQDFWARLHAASIIDSAGVGLILLGMMLWGLPNWRQAFPLRSLGRVLGATLVMLVVLAGWQRWVGCQSVLKLLCAIVLSAFTYGLVIWRSGEIADELIKVQGLWSQRSGRVR